MKFPNQSICRFLLFVSIYMSETIVFAQQWVMDDIAEDNEGGLFSGIFGAILTLGLIWLLGTLFGGQKGKKPKERTTYIKESKSKNEFVEHRNSVSQEDRQKAASTSYNSFYSERRQTASFPEYLKQIKSDYNISAIAPEDWKEKVIDWGIHEKEEHEIWDRGDASYSNDGKKFLSFEDNIVEYRIREGVEILCDNAFANGYRDKKIVLPKSLKVIGNFVFFQTNLGKLVIPESVVIITGNPFVSCRVYPQCYSPFFRYEDSVLYDKEKSRLISVIETENMILGAPVLIPSSVKIIGRCSFYDISCGPIIIPNSVRYIGTSAFEHTIITDIKIGSNVTEIGERAFSRSYLKIIEIPDSVILLGASAFENCKNLRSVKLSKSLTTIEKKAFYGCIYLEEVFIPEGVKVIAEEAFSWCKKLSQIHLPDSLEKIGKEAFTCCGFSSVTIPEHTIVEEGAFMQGCQIIRK